MSKLLLRGLLFYISLLIVAIFLDPDVKFDNILSVAIVTVLLSAINVFVKPMLQGLTLPISTLTLGLVPLIINVVIIFLITDFVPGFHVTGWFWALLFSALISGIFNGLLFMFQTYGGIEK